MSSPPSAATRPLICELKGSGFTFTVLKIFDADIARLGAEVARRIDQAPEFFRGASVIVDVQAVAKDAWHLPELITMLRDLELVPIAIRGAGSAREDEVRAMGLGILGESRAPAIEAKPEVVEKPATARLVTEPVRSGQQIYAKGDLIVVGAVSHGAELLAEGNIHVYGPLRGRALAGLRDNRSARIFCRSLEAELISIAGYYRLAEDLEPAQRGHPVQIHLDGENLHVLPL
ncbi:MAG TPA: septum site-determining protein MinC [Candidatus Macondimonas sp.]|nr:septum site-determining protein MinC [Candidatus Macondimonas sp.]